jgi:outer membrane biosynthesis protein TonB
VQRRIEAALALERFVMGGMGRMPVESPSDLVAEVERHVRALLRDVLCGYLDPDLKSVADDILLETTADPTGEIRARDLRMERAPEAEREVELEPEPEAELEPEPKVELEPEPEAELVAEPEADTSEIEPVAVEQATIQQQLDGVTQSADWGWGEPDDYSAPV